MTAKNILISFLILGVASSSLINEDFYKLLLSGQSNTYSMSLIKHNPIVIFAISLVVILFIFLFKKGLLYKYLLGISLVVWLLSQRTYVIVEKGQDAILVSGFAIVPFNKSKLSAKNNCSVNFYFFMNKEIE